MPSESEYSKWRFNSVSLAEDWGEGSQVEFLMTSARVDDMG